MKYVGELHITHMCKRPLNNKKHCKRKNWFYEHEPIVTVVLVGCIKGVNAGKAFGQAQLNAWFSIQKQRLHVFTPATENGILQTVGEITMKKLQLQLRALIKTKKKQKKNRILIDRTNPYTDYCKELCEPGSNKRYPEGCVGLRVDDDFWAVALVPYKFKDLTVQELVKVIFPNAKNPSFCADSGSEEQKQEWYTASRELYEREIQHLLDRGYTLEKAKEEADLFNPDRDPGKSLREEEA